jgi:hypothetical protein
LEPEYVILYGVSTNCIKFVLASSVMACSPKATPIVGFENKWYNISEPAVNANDIATTVVVKITNMV